MKERKVVMMMMETKAKRKQVRVESQMCDLDRGDVIEDRGGASDEEAGPTCWAVGVSGRKDG